MAQGIWKDLVVEVDNPNEHDYMIFKLEYNGNIIYAGRIYPEPGGSTTTQYIIPNQICRDYLYQQLPSLLATGWTDHAPLACYFTWEAFGPGLPLPDDSGNFIFNYDWSNDYGYTTGSAMSVPINGHTDVRAPFLVTDLSGSKTIQVNDGTTTTNVTLTSATSIQGNGVYLPPVGTKFIQNGSVRWAMVAGCNRYLLYYVNSHGGWDQFLIEGNTKEKDAVTTNQYAPTFDNSVQTNWGTRTYQKVMAKTYKMQTGWLTDDQAGRMHHLLESPLVYMYDLVDGTCVPVNIANSECEWQTYRGNGRKMAQYAIEVKVARNTERR